MRQKKYNMNDGFIELKYGKYYSLDVHGASLEECNADIIHVLSSIDITYKAVLVIHGYHGSILKDFIRNSFKHKLIAKKINIDAGRTLLVITR